MIKTGRRAVNLSGIGREIAYRRVVVSLALSSFSLHNAHGPPINLTIYFTP